MRDRRRADLKVGPYRRRCRPLVGPDTCRRRPLKSRSRPIAMKIAVCIKQVPTREWQPRLRDDKTWIREQDVSYEMNEPDAYALEEACAFARSTAARWWSVPPVRRACSRSFARRWHAAPTVRCTSKTIRSPRPMHPSRAGALAGAMAEEKFDLVLTGLQSDDQGHAQTGVVLAERLGIPHSTIIMEVQVEDERLRVKRELEGGWFQWIAMPLPALLTIQSGINQLRYATLKGIMAAKKKEIRQVPLAAWPAAVTADRDAGDAVARRNRPR